LKADAISKGLLKKETSEWDDHDRCRDCHSQQKEWYLPPQEDKFASTLDVKEVKKV